MKSENGKTIRRISILAALVLLVCMALGVSVMAETTVVVGDACYTHGDIIQDGNITEEDAIYLLYHSVFGEDEYPLTNYEKEGEIIGLDAIALFELIGQPGKTVHAYSSEPAWNWDAQKAVFKCACGDVTIERDMVVTTTTKAATCVEPGSSTFHATANLTDKAVYTAERTIQTGNASGIHKYDTDVLCLDRTCDVCGHVDVASEHDYQVVDGSAREATCTEAASITKKCTGCGDAYEETSGVPTGHTFGAAVKTHVEKCEYKDVYECSECDATTDGEHYFVHTETAKITKEATCTVEGTKRYTCEDCGVYHDEKVATVADAHTWSEGKEEGTLIVYSCKENSNHTRTAINFAAEAEAKVSSAALVETKEIDINGASLTLDEKTASNLQGDVEIKAEKNSVDELKLDEGVKLDDDVKKQIGKNPVYNFSITDATGEVGKEENSIAITISIPYTLQAEDDPDCIDIWFIDDDGSVTVEKGTYANGAVTFTATHFSYYTVTRLTPEERCAAYGHNDAVRTVAATCTEDGYELHVCARCNKSWKEDEVQKTGHSFVSTTTDATCAKAGSTVVTCEKCDYKKTTTIPAKGHTWETTTETATCAEAKKVSVGCETCDATKEIILAQKMHDTETTPVAATCETRGYNLIECKNCDYEVTEYTDSALGHSYGITWEWNKEDVTAKAVFTCENCDDSFDKAATVTISKESPVTCTEDGYVDYVAKVIYNAKVNTDGYTVVTPATGHNTTEEWQYNTVQHFHECSICKDKLEAADHGMDAGVVTKEANCTEAGEKVYSCDTCKYQVKEVIPAEGHELDNGVCIKCGFGEEICKHDTFHTVELELAIEDGFCGGIVSYDSCECGRVRIFTGYDLACYGEWGETTETDENGYVKYDSTFDCTNCKLHIDEILTWDIDKDACIGTQYIDLTISKGSEEVFAINSAFWSNIKHPNAIHSEADDLSKYGMCPGTATMASCPCGQDEMTLFAFTCNWVEVPEECGPGIYTTICTECGVKQVSRDNFVSLGNCEGRYTEVITFYKGQNVLVSYEYSFNTDEHDVEYSFDIADGATCSDGYTVHVTCKNCDYEHSYFEKPQVGVHYTYTQVVDLSQYNLCGGKEAIVRSCPCGQECHVELDYWAHRWVESNGSRTDTENGYIISAVKTCQDCGLKDTFRNVITATGNGCEYSYDYTGTYSVNGKVLFDEAYTYFEAEHNWEVVDAKLKGDTCEDGVDITYECRVCHATGTDTSYYHEEYTKEIYNSAEYGMCAGVIEVYGCACDKYNQVIEDTPCDWEFVGWYDGTQVQNQVGTDTERYYCENCNTYKDITRKEGTPIGCAVPGTVTYDYIKGVTVELSVVENYFDERHDFTYTFDIADGASCSDGFRVYRNCENCDYSESWNSSAAPGDHARYKVETYDMAELGFCAGYTYKIECPCGEIYGFSWEDEGCNWGFPQYDQQTGANVQTCINCSGVRKMTESVKQLGGCSAERIATYTYFRDGVEKLSVNTKELFQMHDYETAFEIANGASCSDGYTIYRTCKKCGDETVTPEKPPVGVHPTYNISSVDMKEFGFCGGQVMQASCACGENKAINMSVMNSCNFVWVDDDPSGKECQQCTVCGSRVLWSYDAGIIDSCHDYDKTIYEFYTADGTYVTKCEYIETYDNHDDIVTLEAVNGNCENGYTVTMVCQRCNDVRTNTDYGHVGYCTSKINLAEKGLCGGEIRFITCACGQNQNSFVNDSCMWEPVGYNNATGEQTYACMRCSATKVESVTMTDMDQNCTATRTAHTMFYNANGEFVGQSDYTEKHEAHNDVITFEMQGPSCEDGYYVIRTCKNCNRVEREDSLYRGHQSWAVEVVDLSEKGLCGDEARHWKCACGESDYWGFNGPICSWSFEDEYGNSTCYICGATRNTVRTTSKVEGKPCYTKEVVTNTYTNSNGEVWTTVSSSTNTNHDIVYTLSLKDPAADCMSGYIATGTCSVCGETVTVNSWGHDRHLVEKVDLSDDGLCVDATVKVYRCACGAFEEISDNSWESGCNWWYEGATSFNYSWSYDEATNSAYSWDFETATADAYRCYGCKGVKYHATASGAKDENCYGPVSTVRLYYNNNGEQVYEVVSGRLGANHNYEFTGEIEWPNSENCEEGYYQIMACTDCGNTYKQHYWGHNTHFLGKNDLSQYGVCAGAYVEEYGCACGMYDNVNVTFGGCNLDYSWNSYIDPETGISHQITIQRCMNCDVVCKTDNYTVIDIANCKAVYTTVHTYMIGDVLLVEPQVVEHESEYHDCETTATLVEGATSCEDGVLIKETCKNCAYSYESVYEHHYAVPLEYIDLKDCGSQCGGYVEKIGCACGAENGVNVFSNCDLNYQYISSELQYPDQETIDGYHGDHWKEVERATCPAQDAEGNLCGFTIEKTWYYEFDKENCRLDCKTSYELGNSGVSVIEDMYSITYHDYESTESVDGNTTITSSVCAECKSSLERTVTTDSNGFIISEREVIINNANDGNAKYKELLIEYAIYENQTDDYTSYESYVTKAYNKHIGELGDETWVLYEYEYDWDNFDCTRLCKESDHTGFYEEYTESCHREQFDDVIIKDSTCTQFGEAQRYTYCHVCKQSMPGEIVDVWPSCHRWSQMLGSDIYTCEQCGLESYTDGMGSIIFEDLTEAYGNGTDYVIGYYENYYNVVFEKKLFVVVGEHDMYLPTIDFVELTRENDGITAISFNKAAAEAAAETVLAENGYTAGTDYALRFVFVPEMDDANFDYAITLTDESIQN